MDDYYNHISDRQAKLYIISIAGVIVSIICAIILYPIFAVTSLEIKTRYLIQRYAA